MKLYHYIVSALALLLLAGCTVDNDMPEVTDQECLYSFTAVLGGADTRISYHEDAESGNLKMVWDEGDEIRLYPDESMNDTTKYYVFVANTGKGTQRTVFVHQGYIPNWEHWSGRAIYVFPNDENLDVEDNSEPFRIKFHTQKSNNNLDHIIYAEHVLGEDGSKQYKEYWSDHLVDYNLKHDHEMHFNHPHTVVYKLMLRGFIYDIPGGSVLRMSGDAWPDGEVTTLTLGSKDDKEPFLKVGEFGRKGYNDTVVLTAYIIRQVVGDTDGKIKAGGKLRFELLAYDKDDGKVYPLHPDDQQTHRKVTGENGENIYFTNQPWGDEYTWEVEVKKDSVAYNVGDYVVADLTDLSNDDAYPRIAIDLGLPKKWAAYNVGAKKVDDYGSLYTWGYITAYSVYVTGSSKIDSNLASVDSWNPGDSQHDAATAEWGPEWVTPAVYDMLDLVYYCRLIDSNDKETELRNSSEHSVERWKDPTGMEVYLWKSIGCTFTSNGVKLVRWRSTLNGRYFYWPLAGDVTHEEGAEPGKKGLLYTCNSFDLNGKKGPETFSITSTGGLAYSIVEHAYKKAISRRAVKK